MKKLLVISTSLRTGSNSDIYAKEAAKGAKEAGYEVEIVSLKDKNIAFCKGCLACQDIKKCVINDDAVEITEKIRTADVLLWAVPVYYYEMPGQMKTLIDRSNSLYVSDRKFKKVYLITSSADDSEGVSNSIVHGIKGWLDCLPGAELAGVAEFGGVNSSFEAADSPSLLEKAYEFGKSM